MDSRWKDVERQREQEREAKESEQAEATDLARRFGAVVKRLRTERAVSQEEFAYVAGFHRTYMGLIERGDSRISLHAASKLAKALEMPLSALLKLVEQPQH